MNYAKRSCSDPTVSALTKNFNLNEPATRRKSMNMKNHMIVFEQAGSQSVSSPFSARLHSSSAKSLHALNNNPAGYTG